MTEKLIPGVYVVLPGGTALHSIPEKLNNAAALMGKELSNLVSFVQERWPYLSREEATQLTAAVLSGLPALLESNPEIMQELTAAAAFIKKAK